MKNKPDYGNLIVRVPNAFLEEIKDISVNYGISNTAAAKIALLVGIVLYKKEPTLFNNTTRDLLLTKHLQNSYVN